MIKFNELSVPCKMGIVSGWVCGILFLLFYLIGFVVGVLSA